MSTTSNSAVKLVKRRLIDVAGRTTQDLGLGRIAGQVMGYVFLGEGECSLDDMERDLGLSKAAVSIAAKQLESLGVMERVWKQGDRRSYYRTAQHFGVALRQGLLAMVQNKVRTIGAELDRAEELLNASPAAGEDAELRFVKRRLRRAQKLRRRARQVLESPILKLLGG